jgi:acyl-CoA synthetase (AMP-forming)/AMP-acid ligase II
MAREQPYKRAAMFPAGRDPNGRVAYSHLTFRQLDRESDCIAHGMVAHNITRGTRTILMVRPCLEFFILIFSFFKVGAVPVVVDPGMGIRRMLNCLKESRAQALIGIPPAHVLRVLAPKYFQSVRTHITVGKRWFWKGPTLKDLRIRPWRPYAVPETRKNETAAILFTTGSTGPAKGAVYSHGNFDAQVRMIGSHFGFSTDEIDLPTFPLFSLFDPALGMSAVIPDMDPTRPAQVDPRKIIEAVVNQGVSNMFASPALLNRVGRFGKAKGVKLPSLKRIISSGAPVAPTVMATFSAMLGEDAEIQTGYGATEAMPVAIMGSKEILGETRSLSQKGYGICIGRPVDGVRIRVIGISDDPIEHWSDDLEIPDGEIGELVVQGEMVTRGYFRRPRHDVLSKIKADKGFWHRMGDLGWKDQKGRYWFCGRKGHRVITSAKTLFTVPCEAIFNNHPDVFRSALVGVGPRHDQKPVICIELEPDAQGKNLRKLTQELLALGRANMLTETIATVLFHRSFPVDIRHNSKIFREKLALWAAKQLKF